MVQGSYAICWVLMMIIFYKAIRSFKGASKRLELVEENDQTSVFKDFAHSPSKLMATLKAVKEQYPEKKLVACMELHTFSSLSQGISCPITEDMDDGRHSDRLF